MHTHTHRKHADQSLRHISSHHTTYILSCLFRNIPKPHIFKNRIKTKNSFHSYAVFTTLCFFPLLSPLVRPLFSPFVDKENSECINYSLKMSLDLVCVCVCGLWKGRIVCVCVCVSDIRFTVAGKKGSLSEIIPCSKGKKGNPIISKTLVIHCIPCKGGVR